MDEERDRFGSCRHCGTHILSAGQAITRAIRVGSPTLTVGFDPSLCPGCNFESILQARNVVDTVCLVCKTGGPAMLCRVCARRLRELVVNITSLIVELKRLGGVR